MVSKIFEKCQKQLAAWIVIKCFSVLLGHPSLAYSSRKYGNLICETGYSEGLSYLVFAKFNSFVFVSYFSNWDSNLSSVQARALSYPVTNFYNKESKLHMEFLQFPIIISEVIGAAWRRNDSLSQKENLCY